MFLKDRLNLNTERRYTDEGFLVVPARISRAGIQEYLAAEMGLIDRNVDDIIKVYRPEQEVFSEFSLSSFANKPVTNGHPPELVNAANAKEYSIGHAGAQVTREGSFAKSELYIFDAKSIADIESGKAELSNGYTADIEWTSGLTQDGEQYDAVQRNIKGNHIAIVDRGRAGRDCRVADQLPNIGDITMSKITIAGVDYEVSEQASQAINNLLTRLKEAEMSTEKIENEKKTKEDELKTEMEKAKATEDSYKAKIDDLKTKIPTSDGLDKLVAERILLIDKAKKVLPDLEWESKDRLALMKEVVAAKCQNVQIDSVSADYVQSRFDMLVEATDVNPLDDVLRHQAKNLTPGKVTDIRPASVIARDKMIERNRNAWNSQGGSK